MAIMIKSLVFALSLLLPIKITSATNHVPDFASMKDVKQKKQAFFDFIYQHALTENQAIMRERAIIRANTEKTRIKALCDKYSKDCETVDAVKREALLSRIDVIPPSLILAQAANESAWGTSRFATQANNYFGQWCSSKGCGLVPLRRNTGSTHEVRKFTHAQASVRSYLMNINTGRAYQSIRDMREKARTQSQTLSGIELAAGLKQYSERGQAYVEELRSMIRYNKLVEKYDDQFWQALRAKK